MSRWQRFVHQMFRNETKVDNEFLLDDHSPLTPVDGYKEENPTSLLGEEEEMGELEEDLADEELLIHEMAKRPVKYIRYSIMHIIIFASFRFTYNTLTIFTTSVMFPKDVIYFVGDDAKPMTLGVVLGVAALVNFIAGPITGKISDNTKMYTFKLFGRTIELGKRKPYIFVGMFVYSLSVVGRTVFRFHHVGGLIMYTILSTIGSTCGTIAVTGYTALFPDLFHKSQYDIVSGFMGFFNLLGALFAIGIFGFMWSIDKRWAQFYYVLAAIVSSVGFFLTGQLVFFNEQKSLVLFNQSKADEELDRVMEGKKTVWQKCGSMFQNYVLDFVKPFKYWNFSIVFFARFIFMFAIASVQTFLLYFLRDCIKGNMGEGFNIFGIKGIVTYEEQAQSLVGGIILVMGLVSSFFGPYISSKISRKVTVSMSGLLMVGASLAYIITQNFTVILLSSIVMGIGMGSFYAVDFALVNDVLPNPKESAKDLAIFAIASVIPFTVAAPVGGLLISVGDSLSKAIGVKNFGYILLFGFSIFVQIIGSGVVLLVWKKKKKVSKALVGDDFDQVEELQEFDEGHLEKRIPSVSEDLDLSALDFDDEESSKNQVIVVEKKKEKEEEEVKTRPEEKKEDLEQQDTQE